MRSFKQCALLLQLLLTIGYYLHAQSTQDPAKLPTVIPASPEVAALGKLGSLSAGLHTGSANLSVPLYSITLKSLKFDIALSYSSNGIKVDEIPGRVGLGWNLLAGGVINRTIRDEPDGEVAVLNPPSPISLNNDFFLYLKNATEGSYDTEQ